MTLTVIHPIPLTLLILSCITSYPAFRSLSRAHKAESTGHAEAGREFFEDEDGSATQESQRRYLAVLRPRSALVLAALGLLISFSIEILKDYPRQLTATNWIIVGLWFCCFFQSVAFALERRAYFKFTVANLLGLAASLTILGHATTTLQWPLPLDGSSAAIAIQCMLAVQVVLGLTLLLIAINTPRRPTLVSRGSAVDDQYTASLIRRLTFAWVSPILRHARSTVTSLNFEELPALHHAIRASSLHTFFKSLGVQKALWKTIYSCHKWDILGHYVLAVLHSGAQAASQLVLYRLLQCLEQRSRMNSTDKNTWLWAAALGFSILFAAWLETQILWIVNTRIVICMRTELTTLIYVKVLAKKNVRDSPTPEQAHDSTRPKAEYQGTASQDKSRGNGVKTDSCTKQSASVRASEESNYDTVNLVALDTRRVTDFMGASFLIPASISKLAVSMAILLQLIGWKSVISGLATLALLNPLNIYSSRLINAAQLHFMRIRDTKMTLINEALQGIRQIKFTAMEGEWLRTLGEKRDEELSVQWYLFILRTVLVGFYQIQPILFSAVSLAVYAILTGSLSPSVAFTTIAIFGQIEGSLAFLPRLIVQMQQAAVSSGRIQKFLEAAEQNSYLSHEQGQDGVALESAYLTWPTDSVASKSTFTLRDINVCFPSGKLSVISGDTGSGKSLLLNALVGETDVLSGSVTLPSQDPNVVNDEWLSQTGVPGSSIAFVSQNGWIENATIKNNILFGLPLCRTRYQQTLFACALTTDLAILPDGDATEVGVGGINLSGGQKWRLSFARALYSRARILVIDDIFSAVDAHVGLHMYNNALTGPLAQNRSRIIATHHVELCLAKAQYLVRLEQGRVTEQRLITRDCQENPDSDTAEADENAANVEESPSRSVVHPKQVLNKFKNCADATFPHREPEVKNAEGVPKKFIEEEKRQVGAVRLQTYTYYLGATGGITMLLAVVFLHLGYTGSIMGRSWWLSVWTRHSERAEKIPRQIGILNSQQSLRFSYHANEPTQMGRAATDDRLHFYLATYISISILVCVAGLVKFFSVLVGSIKASKKLFENFTWTIFHAPTYWFDTVPVGRILNRFSSDFAAIDSSMADGMGFLLETCFQLLAIVIAGVAVSPLIILLAAVLLSISVYVARMYLPAARDVKRLESVARSPILEQFQSTIAGVDTIRAYGKAETYITRMMDRIDEYASTSYHRSLFSLWLMLRLNLIGAIFTTMVAAVIVVRRDIDASLAGFALSFALQYTVAVEWTIRQFSATQMAMNSVERVIEYSEMETESRDGHPVPAAWPASGRVDIHDLVVGYKSGKSILKGITMHIEPGERVGIVGRTGAGKSTLSLALFRVLEATSGTISIDGIDVAKIRLHDLRSRLTIIPQDPVLFTGTFRSNLDPFNEHTDSEMCDALERVHFSRTSTITTEDPGEEEEAAMAAAAAHDEEDENSQTGPLDLLSKPVSQGGHNLSQGQRQLLCMARAVIARPKILVMDEATSSVDMKADAAIQKSIRQCFHDSTLIVIAHRLSTLADFDKIFVLEAGEVIEHGSPKDLMLQGGAFWDLVQESGDRVGLKKAIFSSS